MSGDHHSRKRKTGCYAFPSTRENEDDGLAQELREIKSVMQKMVDHMSILQNDMTCMQSKIDFMADKLNNLEGRNGQLETSQAEISDRQQYHGVLLKNQKWQYSAAPPPQSYWDSIGHDQTHVDAARSFLKVIKESTCAMRYGVANACVCVGPRTIHPEPLDPVCYHEAHLPHWHEFANALQGYRHCLKCLPKAQGSSSWFNIYHLNLPPDVLDLLSKALQNTWFEGFHLENNSHGCKCLDFALNYAQNNPILQFFRYISNPIDNSDDLDRICNIIRDHPSINRISFVDCKSEEVSGYEMLCSIITAGTSKLTEIELKDNDIYTGGTFLSDFLAANPVLEYLDLSDNQLDDTDATLIANALRHNTKLRYLGLDDNPITNEGRDALRNTEFDRTSLNSAADSNHTCKIIYPGGIGWFNSGNSENDCVDEPLDKRKLRSRKIYYVLFSRNRKCSNAQHLGDAPVELLPEMLYSIERYSDYVSWRDERAFQPLSVVYEIMRWWDKSLSLYASIGSSHVKCDVDILQ